MIFHTKQYYAFICWKYLSDKYIFIVIFLFILIGEKSINC